MTHGTAATPLVKHIAFAGEMNRVAPGGTPVSFGDEQWLHIEGEQLRDLAYRAVREVSHYLRGSHLDSLRSILDDPEASSNDQFVAHDLLSNAVISSREVLPMCQDTGTIIVHARRGHRVITDGKDAEWISRGVEQAYRELDLRYSQLRPLDMWTEENTSNNLPAQIHIELQEGSGYDLFIMAKGGGSANKSFLFQQNRSVLDETRLLTFLKEKIADIGTSACPPYHIGIAVGGTTAEESLTTAKLASAHHLDHLPTEASSDSWSIRDTNFEQKVLDMTRELGFGAQFGGKYFCHDVRVVRMPRHNGSLPIGLAVSCSADRQIECRIDTSGIWIEELEHEPEKYLSRDKSQGAGNEGGKEINLDRPMEEVLGELRECELGQRLSLTGTLVVARDLVHAALREILENGGELPDWFKNHPIYYAGPSKTPDGYATGSFGPTTAGRMDSYIPQFQAEGGSLVTLAKGNRGAEVTEACGTYGGFYLGTVGGPAARLAEDCIVSSKVIGFPEFGMEAARAIEVKNMPAFVVINNQGEDFYLQARKQNLGPAIPMRTPKAAPSEVTP